MIGRISDNYYNTYYKNFLFGNLFLLQQIQLAWTKRLVIGSTEPMQEL